MSMVTCVFEDGGKAQFRHVVVDTIVLKDGKILLVKRSTKLIDGGKWALPGGYLDLNETTEEGAAREVLEETGWTVKGLKLLTILDSPIRDRQNVSFAYLGKATEKIGEADWESDEVKWFSLSDLPAENKIAFDHAYIIKIYRQHVAENLSLPIL